MAAAIRLTSSAPGPGVVGAGSAAVVAGSVVGAALGRSGVAVLSIAPAGRRAAGGAALGSGGTSVGGGSIGSAQAAIINTASNKPAWVLRITFLSQSPGSTSIQARARVQ